MPEPDSSNLSLVYAAYLYVRTHIRIDPLLSLSAVAHCDERLIARWELLCSSVHIMVFSYASLFFGFGQYFVVAYGTAFLELGNGNIQSQCQ